MLVYVVLEPTFYVVRHETFTIKDLKSILSKEGVSDWTLTSAALRVAKTTCPYLPKLGCSINNIGSPFATIKLSKRAIERRVPDADNLRQH